MTNMASISLASILLMVAFVHSSMPGGWSNVPLNSNQIKTITDYAHDQINQRSNSMTHRRLLHIHEASSQVVAGVKYRLVFDSGFTKCRRNGDMANEVISACDLDKERQIERCTAVVWDRAWLKDRQLLDFSCQPFTSHEDYFGSYQASDRKFHQTKLN